jgi:hypothetical protein
MENHSSTLTKLGDIQQTIGQATGSIGQGVGYFVAFIFFIGAIVCIYFGIKKTSLEESSNFSCGGSETIGCIGDEICVDGKCKTKPTRKPWLLVVAVIWILFGVGIILYSRWYNRFVHSSRTAAQIGATFTEIDMFRNMLK